MFALRTILSAALLLLLAACAAIPVGSLVQLARVDMLETDLNALQAAVWLPAELADPKALAAFPPSAGTYRAYRLAPADIVRFDQVRRTVAAGGAPGSLEIAVGVRQFCRTAALPSGPLRASTYLRTAETGTAWVTLIDGFDLRSDPRIAASLEAIAPC